MIKKNLVTGITATGDLHLGSYLGVMRHWRRYAQLYRCWYFIADLHAITTAQPPALLRQRTLDMAAMFYALQLDPVNNTVFIQSQVPHHAECAWALSCFAHTGEMGRMTQYKDKSEKEKGRATLGLYSYPCLMAADILLYDAHLVPVGADQKQHLELARNIAQRVNQYYDKEIFQIPSPEIPDTCARVMALQNPQKKMSKSDSNTNNSVYLLDSEEVIRRKVMRAVTDSHPTLSYHPERAGLANLIEIYASLQGMDPAAVVDRFSGQGYAVFKRAVAESIISEVLPIQQRYRSIRADEAALCQRLAQGGVFAKEQAVKKIRYFYQHIGFIGHDS